MTTLQRKKEEGWMVPKILLYYQADLLMQWWNSLLQYMWEFEQLRSSQLRTDWALTVNFSPPLVSLNRYVRVLSSVWKKLLNILAPGQSPLATFLGHCMFQQAAKISRFQVWVKHNL